MRRSLLLVLLALLLLPGPVAAGRRSELRLTVPEAGPAPAAGRVVVIERITDRRRFEDRPATAATPSIAEGGVAATSAEERRFLIARVRDGYGKARNNLFLEPAQPVEEVVREVLVKGLAGMGYRVVADRAQAAGDALIMEVEIDQLWGYIEVKGGGGWAGDIPKMAGEIRTVLNVRGPNGNGRYEVSGRALHSFALMTGGHWVKMFEELFRDYQQDLARVRFSN